MRASILLASALGATVFAAPATPTFNADAAAPGGLDSVAEYFNMLAVKVKESRKMAAAPICDLSKAQMPIASPTPLPPPAAGYILKHVAIGRGTQNYTCDTKNATAVPVGNGALATLYNASCIASAYPDLLNTLPKVAIQFNLTDVPKMPPSNLVVSGIHYFTTATTPFFNLDIGAEKLGQANTAKNASVPAPADAPKGQGGEAAVAWLKLNTKPGATGDLTEVYRLETAGGSAPATCVGMPAEFNVEYSAQYWFFESPPKK
ncbi:hypothetical protein GE09DRAFT_1215654 [Coniochaeta sp. 2T2.1]|nr:hypothetical protein GE09DRAFT_1215654 [Coniochaeta sp. 2T2.1]